MLHTTTRSALGGLRTTEDMDLGDLEAVRLILHGASVIDWHHLSLRDHAEVDRFLRVNEFDPASHQEMQLLEALRDEAVEYLEATLNIPIPDHVAHLVPVRDLFLIASSEGPNQRWACIILKVMNIVHHIAGREAVMRLPIADDTVFRAIELKVMHVVEELRAAGYPIAEFQWSRKPRASVITKLLAKRSTLAAKIYDKLRFRLIVRHYSDLMPMLAVMTHKIVPFNYIIPGESVNRLLPFESVVHGSAKLTTMEAALQREDHDHDHEVSALGTGPNEFTAPDYRIVNFVADLPLRVSDIVDDESQIPPGCSHVVFVLTEFQLADERTATLNELGDSSHEAYKQRQRDKVRRRLARAADGSLAPGVELSRTDIPIVMDEDDHDNDGVGDDGDGDDADLAPDA